MGAPTGNQNARKLHGTGPTRVARIPAEWDVIALAERIERVESTLTELRTEIAAAEERAGGRPLNSRWHIAQRWLAEIEQAWASHRS